MTPYPDTLPVNAINGVVADIRNKALVSDRVNFAKSVWELQGYALKLGLGDPASVGPVTPVKAAAMDLTDAEVAEHLEKLLTPEFSFVNGPEGTSQGLINLLPWTSILKWALTALVATL